MVLRDDKPHIQTGSTELVTSFAGFYEAFGEDMSNMMNALQAVLYANISGTRSGRATNIHHPFGGFCI